MNEVSIKCYESSSYQRFKWLKGTERDLKELKGTADEISSDPL